jgi:threonine synthase
VLEVRGNFDDALAAARELAARGTHALVNSLNPYRIEGQKTAVLEIVEELGSPPDTFVVPYGGGGNTTAYALGLRDLGATARLVSVEAAQRPTTVASAIRIPTPAHSASVAASAAEVIAVADDDIVAAWRELAATEGLLCEPASAAGLAAIRLGAVGGERIVVTITGHGLKDPETAAAPAPAVGEVDADPDSIAAAA